MREQSKDITKIQFDKQVGFIGVEYRNIGEELLNGLRVIQR